MRELAVGLCIRPADRALLVEHGYDRVTGARFYRAIGGGREPGETGVEAVVREWREEFGLEVRVVRELGSLDNRFVYEGRAGHEHVTVFELMLCDPAVYLAVQLEGCDPTGLAHTATWVAPSALGPGAPPLYPVGVLEVLRTSG